LGNIKKNLLIELIAQSGFGKLNSSSIVVRRSHERGIHQRFKKEIDVIFLCLDLRKGVEGEGGIFGFSSRKTSYSYNLHHVDRMV
jgi:hypothetical protein